MIISIIVGVDKNFLIGNGDNLPWHFMEDLQYFKEKTMGKFVIMGERTYLPIKDKLTGRKVIVLSRNSDLIVKEAQVAMSIEEALSLTEGEVMIAGGRSVYEQFLKIADRIYLTVIDKEYEGDVYFPKIDEKEWKIVSSKKGDNPLLTFNILERVKENT